MQIGEEIRRRREEQGLTGFQLAVKAGMAPSAVSQIETGKRTPSSASVVKLAAALGVEVGDLYPKAQAPLPFDDPTDDEEQRRMLPYVHPWLLYLERYCERWEAALDAGTPSKGVLKEFGANFDDVMAAIDALFRALRYVGFDDPLAGPIGLTLREALARLATVLRRVADAQFDHYVGDELRQAKTRAARQRAVLDEITKAQVG